MATRVLAAAVILLPVLLVAVYELSVRRQERRRREQEYRARMMQRYPSDLRPPIDFKKPAAKGIRPHGGKDAA